MDKSADIEHWLRSMGYEGEVPETISQINTNATAFIWDQLLQNAKSKCEIEHVRNNVIIHRLQKKPLDKQEEFSYPIKEISLYIKKQMLETKLRNKQLILSEKQGVVNNLSQNNKMQYLMIEQLEDTIKQNEEREYLLKKKCELLEENIRKSEELLINNSKLSTTKQLQDISDVKDVTVVLQESADKLKKVLCTIAPTDGNITQKNQFYSTKKPYKTSNLFENYIATTASKSVRKTATKPILRKKRPDTIKRNLFASEPDISNRESSRDSLGLMPDICFRDDDNVNDDDFLTSSKKNFTSLSYLNLHLPENPKDVFEQLLSDVTVRDKLRNLLHNYDRHLIWNIMQKLSEDLHLEVIKNVYNDNCDLSTDIHEDDISKIHVFHIQIELQRIQNNVTVNHMNNQIKRKKENIKSDLLNRRANDIENIMKFLDLLLENVDLDASLLAIKKEIHSAKSYEQNEDLQIILRKLTQVKTNMIKKVNSINHYIGLADNMLQTVLSSRNKTLNCVRKLGPFILDMDAIEVLKQELNSKEIKTFEEFPLKYNQRCTYTDPSVYYRNICMDNFPLDRKLDSDSLYIISEMIGTPFTTPEVILLDILRAKKKLDFLLSLKDEQKQMESEKYSLEELKKQESYLQSALDRLNYLNCATQSAKTIAVGNNIKTMLQIWHEMPYKDFISSSCLVDGKDFKFYEKQFDNYFNNL